MLINSLLLLAGFAVLIYGADALVSGASALARKFKIPDLTIGLTIVAFGTSAPELVVSVVAAFNNHQDIVFGNVIGSNIFNLFIILGISGVIYPIKVQTSTVWKEIPVSFFAVLLLFVLSADIFADKDPILSRFDGAVLLAVFSAFLLYVFKYLKNEAIAETTERKDLSPLRIFLKITLGLAGLIVGGRFVVMGAVEIATVLGMSEKVIGLTVVAAGTSLPELATSLVAAFRKNSDIAVGNIIGSNIFNFLLIPGITAILSPIAYHFGFNIEMGLLAAGTVFLFVAMFTGIRKKLDRWEAAVLIVIYLAYTVFLFSR